MNKKSTLNSVAYKLLTLPNLKAITKTLIVFLLAIYANPLYSQTPPPAPTNVTANPTAVCPSSPFTFLKATSAGNTIKWYNVETGGTPIGSSTSGVNFSVSVTSPSTYYAEAVTPANVVSESRTSISVGVNTTPVITYMPPDVNTVNTSGQCGTIVTYPSASAIGNPQPNIIYSDSSGSNFIGGSTTVIVNATNICATTSLSFDVTVNDVEIPTIVTPPDMTLTAPAGSSIVVNPNLGVATVQDNCGILTIYNNAPAVFEAGVTPVIWTTVDYNNNVNSTVQYVTVLASNMPPSITSVTTNDTDNVVGQGSSITLTADWTDEQSGGPYTVEIDWRDSSAHTILTGINGYSISETHTYNKSGVFAPVVTVTDGSNLSYTTSLKFIVVYVSADYSTTCSGFFTAPAGSLVSNPNLPACYRKVEVGNHCKPKCGAPGQFNGELEIEMNGAHFEFEADHDVDWEYLAVSQCYLAEFKGSGYMYPSGHKGGCKGKCRNNCNHGYNPGYRYGILVVQSDKTRNPLNKNKIRIKIWNKDLGDVVIFDTQLGDPDYALPTTSLSCGTIKVRVPNSCVPRLLNPTYDFTNVSDEVGQSFASSVSPNPFLNDFTLNTFSETDENVQLVIYDILGNVVQRIQNIKNNESHTVTNNLSPGVYFVHVTQGANSQVIKVVKNAK